MEMRLSGIACFLIVTVFLLLQAGSAAAEYSFSGDADAVERAADSVFMLEVYDAHSNRIAVGSGFVIFQPDLIATNYHVIEDGAYTGDGCAISQASADIMLQSLVLQA